MIKEFSSEVFKEGLLGAIFRVVSISGAPVRLVERERHSLAFRCASRLLLSYFFWRVKECLVTFHPNEPLCAPRKLWFRVRQFPRALSLFEVLTARVERSTSDNDLNVVVSHRARRPEASSAGRRMVQVSEMDLGGRHPLGERENFKEKLCNINRPL